MKTMIQILGTLIVCVCVGAFFLGGFRFAIGLSSDTDKLVADGFFLMCGAMFAAMIAMTCCLIAENLDKKDGEKKPAMSWFKDPKAGEL
jgi:hypothetical protein